MKVSCVLIWIKAGNPWRVRIWRFRKREYRTQGGRVGHEVGEWDTRWEGARLEWLPWERPVL